MMGRIPADADDLDIPGDAYTDPNLIAYETDPATGETADDALEATRSGGRNDADYRFPVEDSSPLPVQWSTHPTQDSTQEAEWREVYIAPEHAQSLTSDGDPEVLDAEMSSDMGVDRIVSESYFENEAGDLNDADEAALMRLATDADQHPGSQSPDQSDGDTLPDTDALNRGTGSQR